MPTARGSQDMNPLKSSSWFLVISFVFTNIFLGTAAGVSESQQKKEASIEAVVRNKFFDKAGHIELTPTAGIMPFSSLFNQYYAGGRLLWHLHDHYGWEIADVQFSSSSMTSYANDVVVQNQISNVQTAVLKWWGTSNFVLSPFYGKYHLWGHTVLEFDFYLVAGIGAANAQVEQLSATITSTSVSPTRISTNIVPVFDVGAGTRIFLSRSLGVVIDLRDYLSYVNLYNSNTIQSNFALSAGLSFFLPGFG